ncbi:MAG TPA: DUF916 domain-containing protein [Ktedonobacteraceae bacterium]|nr:DUF916 domain-containing protein [Ktedonobacteraceae bacterium]
MRYVLAFLRCKFWHTLLIAVFCCTALFAGTGFMAFGSNAQAAAGEPVFSLQPVIYGPAVTEASSYFAIAAARGESVQEKVRVTNAGSATGTARLSPVDATTAPSSGIAYLSAGQGQHDVGAWITLAVRQVTLAPHQSQVVQFQISIPKDGRAGQHVGGIAVQDAALPKSTSAPGKNQVQINVQQRYVVPIVLTLPGPQSEALAAAGIQPSSGPGYQYLLVALSNTGNLMLKPRGSLQVTDDQGDPPRNLTINLDTFLPQTSINYPVYIQTEALAVGTYQAALALNYGHNHVLRYTTTFTITAQQLQKIVSAPLKVPPLVPSYLPLWLMILLAALALLVIAGISGLFTWRLAARSARGARKVGARHGWNRRR